MLVYLIWAVLLQETFERAKAWVKELQRQASPNIVIALAGNKADLAERRLVEFEVTRWCGRTEGFAGDTLRSDVPWLITHQTVNRVSCSVIHSYQ